MTGWRIGYTRDPEALIQALIKLQSQSTSNATSIAQYAALEAMRGPMETVPLMPRGVRQAPEAHRGGLARDSRCDLRMAGGRFLCLPELFGAPFERRWKTSARKLVHGNLEIAAGESYVPSWPGRGLRRAGLFTAVLRYLHRKNRGGLRRLESFFSRAEAAS